MQSGLWEAGDLKIAYFAVVQNALGCEYDLIEVIEEEEKKSMSVGKQAIIFVFIFLFSSIVDVILTWKKILQILYSKQQKWSRMGDAQLALTSYFNPPFSIIKAIKVI